MLTREMIQTGAYLNSFKDLPQQPRWSRQRIEASMLKTLAQRSLAQPVWLFAYGSLIWNPLFKYAEMQSSVLHGWHLSFCIRLHDGRVSVDTRGRMCCRRTDSEHLVQMINAAGTPISTEPTEPRCSTVMSLNRCRKCAQ